MTKYWAGDCVESLEPGMFLAVKDYVDKIMDCYWCGYPAEEDFKKGWFVAEYIGEDSENTLVFRLYPTKGVGYPVVSYEGLLKVYVGHNIRPVLDLEILEEENYN